MKRCKKRFSPKCWVALLMAIAIVLSMLTPLLTPKEAEADSIRWIQRGNTLYYTTIIHSVQSNYRFRTWGWRFHLNEKNGVVDDDLHYSQADPDVNPYPTEHTDVTAYYVNNDIEQSTIVMSANEYEVTYSIDVERAMEIAYTLLDGDNTVSELEFFGSAIVFAYYRPYYESLDDSLGLDTAGALPPAIKKDNENYADAMWEINLPYVVEGLKFRYTGANQTGIANCGLGWSQDTLDDLENLYDVPITISWGDQPINVVYIDQATGNIIEEEEVGTYEIGSDVDVDVKTQIDRYRRVFMYYGPTAGYIEEGDYVYPYESIDQAKNHSNTSVALEDTESDVFENVVTYNNGGTTVVCVMEENPTEVRQFWIDEDGNELKENEELGPYDIGDMAEAQYEEVLTVDGERYELVSSHIRTLTISGEENPVRYKRTVEDDGLEATQNREREADRFGFNFYGVYRPAEAPPGTVTVTYLTETGDEIQSEEIGQFPIGSTVTGDSDFTVEETLEYMGSNYNIQSSYTVKHTDPEDQSDILSLDTSTLEEVKRRSEEVIEEGVTFYYIMRIEGVPTIPPPQVSITPTPPPPPSTNVPNVSARPTVTMDIVDPRAEGVVHADDRGAEKFDVETTGIPTSEYTYVNVTTDEFLMSYEMVDNVGYKATIVTVEQPYTWTYYWYEYIPQYDIDGNYTGELQVKHTETRYGVESVDVTIYRQYAYYTVESFELYELDHSDVDQYCLPGETIELRPHGYTSPTYSYSQGGIVSTPPDTADYRFPNTVPVPGEYTSDPGYSISSSAAESAAESVVPNYQVQNDTLIVNGDTYLDGSVVEEETNPPTPAITDQSQIPDVGEDVLYEDQNYIDDEKENGWFDSEGTVTYVSVGAEGSGSTADLEFDARVNRVLIHTPVICYPEVTDDSKEWTQLITVPSNPDTALLVLDKEFTIYYPTDGEHKTGLGYGDRDYEQYIAERQVQFPFDAYDGNTFIPANEWYSITGDESNGYETDFYVPIWVEEGSYTINFRTISINADANDPNYEQVEDEFNEEYRNYVANNTITCVVSGRLYGLEITDISDYPTWEEVFRPSSGTGTTYPVGKADEDGTPNGLNCLETLPLVNGSHPTFNNVGITGTGYFIRFKVSTLGSMDYDDSYIQIYPSFYWISEDGSRREEVDVYYSETINGIKHNLVKIGSAMDQGNIHRIEVGDPMLNIPQTDLATTASILGLSLNEVKAQNQLIYSFGDIRINDSLRVFVGQSSRTDAPAEEITKSMQDWYCEYYLPSEIHITPKDQVLPATVTYNESFWKKDGYLLVNFDITSSKDGSTANLSYINASNAANGFLNQWNKEDPCYTKTDWEGNRFSFVDGDFVLFKIGDSAGDDWESEGTH